MKNKSYYIARDKDKSLWMYIYKPCRGRDNKFWLTCSSADGHILAAKLTTKGNTYPYVDLFNNLSFEDEPLKLIPKKTNEHVDGKSYFIAADDNGRVYLFNHRPVKNEENGTWKVAPEGHCQPFESSSTFKSGIFKNLTYNNDPVELVLVDEDESSTEEPAEELMKKYVETKSYYIVRNPNDAVFIFNCKPIKKPDGTWGFPHNGAPYAMCQSVMSTSGCLFRDMMCDDEPLELEPPELVIGGSYTGDPKVYYLGADEMGVITIYDEKPKRCYKCFEYDSNGCGWIPSIPYGNEGRLGKVFGRDPDADNLEPFFHGLHYWNEPLKLVHVNKTINRPVEEKPIESCFDRLFDISLT